MLEMVSIQIEVVATLLIIIGAYMNICIVVNVKIFVLSKYPYRSS